ncbi:DUF3563 family protein [Mangrovibrevibacter kandeliae]|uniref:DUF3563 family protein n=1 Tax=Mangrovibrevibacter kandeliae TaxID=2968473 RepID=UPI0021192824|nr:DUF3563 family protein [Aurantimonas sp. CSK15Z-1]MCQ8781784.1 DUF3563 family protein [Aurantimonas sp. CSK15Z-1]
MKIARTLRAMLGGNEHVDFERNYLNQAVSLADLERRQRELDAGRRDHRYYSF